MTGDQIAQLSYLVLLGTAIAGWFFIQNRRNLGKMAQQAAVWGLIFVGAIAAAGLWSDIRDEVTPMQTVVAENVIEVPRGFDGHYRLSLQVNGTPVTFIVDTGASEMVLSREDAARIGIDVGELRFTGRASTANGITGTAPIWLDTVALGPIVDRNVRAIVNEGELFGSLLGMGYLNRFTSIEIRDNRLLLTR